LEKIKPADTLAGEYDAALWSDGLLLGVMDAFTFPSSRVFAFRLPLSQKLAGLGIAINGLCVFAIILSHWVSQSVGLSPTWPDGEWLPSDQGG